MKRIYHFQTSLVFLSFIFSLQAQTTLESHIVVAGDTTVLNIDNYTVGDIQWQTKDSLLGSWEDMPGANQASLAIPFAGAISHEKYYRAILFNSPNGETYFTDAIRFEIRGNPADISVGEVYAGGDVFLNQDSFIYIVAALVFQAPYGCDGLAINGADGAGIGDGSQNTLNIVQQCQEDSTAAWLCDKLVHNGFDDWFMPSVEELETLLTFLLDNNLYELHNGSRYWFSSTESTSNSFHAIIINKFTDYEPTLQVLGKYYDCCINYLKAIRRQNHSEKVSHQKSLSFKAVTETEQIVVVFPDSNNSNVQVLFDGLSSPGDQFEWDFAGGEVFSGEGLGPYLLAYDFGGYVKVKLTQFTQEGDTLHFESEPFRPKLFRKQPIELPRFYWGTLSTADFNNDGFEDFLLSGSDTTQLYRNLNGENFEPTPSPFPNLNYSFSDFGDFNNDGFPDLLIGGYFKADSTYLTKLFQNMSGTDWEEQDLELPGLVHGFCEWTDYDRDGFADFLVSGVTIDSMAYTSLFKGDGTGAFDEVQTPFEDVGYSTGAFGDYNNDNFPDLVISGSRDSVRYARLYKNENGEFIETAMNILPVNNGSATWADYNNDGWLDFSVSGNREDIVMNPYLMANSNDYNNINAVSFLHYLNLTLDSFKVSSNGSLGQRFVNSIQAPADMDNDGKEDIIIIGQSAIAVAVGGTGGGASGLPSHILRKTRIVFYKSFSTDSTLAFNNWKADIPITIRTDNNSQTGLDSYQFRALALFDFNKDGRTDLLRGGATPEYPSALYTNTIYRSNTAPTTPKNLLSEIISCDSFYLSWDHATDDLTPDVALVYDLYIGTAPGAGDILSIVNNDQLQNNWFRLNRPLEKGTYYWSVRARDGARIFGEWASEASFTIGVPTPTITFDGTQLTSDAVEGNQWYNNLGPIPGATENIYKPAEDGLYYCLVTNDDGCVSDTSNVVEVVLTVVDENGDQGFRIFPNPFTNELIIDGELSKISSIKIYPLLGHMTELKTKNGTFYTDTNDYSTGLYVLVIFTNAGERFTYKLVKI